MSPKAEVLIYRIFTEIPSRVRGRIEETKGDSFYAAHEPVVGDIVWVYIKHRWYRIHQRFFGVDGRPHYVGRPDPEWNE